MMSEKPIAIIGAGSWGTALAILLARKGMQVRLWGRDANLLAEMQSQHCNLRYLPDIAFPKSLTPCAELAECVAGVENVLVAVPSYAFHEILQTLKPLWQENMCLLWGTKGIDPRSGLLLHALVQETLGKQVKIAAISGPSFAREVAIGLPTAVTISGFDEAFAHEICELFHTEHFRPYYSHDVIGVEISGIVKNVLAIASGISDGLGYGANARSALITRGLAELVRLGEALDADAHTFYGLAGVGDLILTATDNQSRNRRFGMAIGRGLARDAALAEVGQVVEGNENSRSIYNMAQKLKVEMPIINAVYHILYKGASAKDAVAELLGRSLRAE